MCFQLGPFSSRFRLGASEVYYTDVANARWLRLSLKAAGGGGRAETLPPKTPPWATVPVSLSHVSGFLSWQGEGIMTPLSSPFLPFCPFSPVGLHAKW